ncbi:MAG: TadE/TadG family type IV pilus assembly protein [Isosphaeraceae bacterium]
MVVRKIPRSRPRGAVVVETAVIISLVLTVILGVFTYARLLTDWSLLNNAAREGCRYALANNTSSTVSSSVQSIVTGYMGGETSRFNNFAVTVSGTHGGVSTPVNNLAPGDPITVSVSGTYNFLQIIPLVKMPTNLTVQSAVTMLCEGGT